MIAVIQSIFVRYCLRITKKILSFNLSVIIWCCYVFVYLFFIFCLSGWDVSRPYFGCLMFNLCLWVTYLCMEKSVLFFVFFFESIDLILLVFMVICCFGAVFSTLFFVILHNGCSWLLLWWFDVFLYWLCWVFNFCWLSQVWGSLL